MSDPSEDTAPLLSEAIISPEQCDAESQNENAKGPALVQGLRVQETYLSKSSHHSRKKWLGVLVISLLNFMTAFSIVIYAPVADLTRQHLLLTTLTPVNWLYISGAFVYAPASIASIYVIRRSAKTGLITGTVTIIIGSWLRYFGTEKRSYSCVLIGSMLCGASQSFALNLPSHYSNLWFTEHSRVTATALMSLANPLGQAIGTLVVPFMATSPSEISTMTLYVALLFTFTTCFAVFTPARPATAESPEAHIRGQPFSKSIQSLAASPEFYYILIQFAVLVAAFNAFATLVEQLTRPYGFTDVQAGVIGAVVVVVGLFSGVATAPILDKTHAYKLPIVMCVTASSASYLAMIFAIRPYSSGVFIGVIVLAAVIGCSGLILLPLALELATQVTLPVAPEITSALLWVGGQGLGGIFIIIMDALRTRDSKYTHGMVFLAVMTSLPIPFSIALVRSKKVALARAAVLDDPGH